MPPEISPEQVAEALRLLRLLKKERRRYYFHRKVDILAADSGTNNLDFRNEDAGREYHVQGSAVFNDTTDYTWLGWGVLDGELHVISDEEITPLKDTYYVTETERVITEGQTYRAQLTGCTADDVVAMHLWGWWEGVK